MNQEYQSLTNAYRGLQDQLERQQALSRYQRDLIACNNEDDIFRRLFAMFVERSGPVFGTAMLCDDNAELQLLGRFGVPSPDGLNFCRALANGIVPMMLEDPAPRVLDAMENLNLFAPELHPRLTGVTLLVVPLRSGASDVIGVVVLYRKGEQPFTEDDVALATLIAPSTAAAAAKT